MAATAPHSPPPAGRNRGLIGAVIAIPIILGIGLLAVWAWDRWNTGEEGVLGEQQFTVVDEIVSNPAVFYDREVTVTGVVTSVISPWAYTIRDPDAAGNQELLVIGSPPPAIAQNAPNLEDPADETVRINGTVRQFDRAAIEQELGTTLPGERLAEFNGRPVIVGESTGLTGRTLTDLGESAELAQIVENPDAWYGQRAAVAGTISGVMGDDAFMLDGGLLVIDGTGMVEESAFRETQTVEVAGVIRVFNIAEIESETGLTLDHEVLAQLEGQPVLVADGIHIVHLEAVD